MNFSYRILVYLLPIPMWLAEFFMRSFMRNPEANDFFPSSLAGIALGMLVPVISPKKGALITQSDEAVRQAGVITLFIGTLLWIATVFLSIGGRWPAGWIGESVDQKVWISVILYFVAFVLSEWKERI
jgi:hypothetical protein